MPITLIPMLVPIEQVLDLPSCDAHHDEPVRDILPRKAQDPQYERLLLSLNRDGFTRPLAIDDEDEWRDGWVHSNGHHRLAAAYELGYRYIPYVFDSSGIDTWEASGDEWGETRYRMKRYFEPHSARTPRSLGSGIDIQALPGYNNPTANNRKAKQMNKTQVRDAVGRGKFTVEAFAAARGIKARTAREALRSLEDAGVVERLPDTVKTGKRGRPAHLFRVR